jgi:putative ABC transport system permease protein
MSIFESVRTSLEAIVSNKLRALLTMLGIIIGVGAVLTLSSVGEGVQADITERIQSVGSNVVFIRSHQPEDATGQVELTTADYELLQNPLYVPDLQSAAPIMQGVVSVTRDDTTSHMNVTGTTAAAEAINNLTPISGGFITAGDVAKGAKVAVLGWNTYADLFAEDEYPIGATVIIDGTRFQVVGVLEPKSGFLGEDDTVYVPVTTAQRRLFTRRTLSGDYPLNAVAATVTDESRTDMAVAQITATLRGAHGIEPGDEDDFEIITQRDVLSMSEEITSLLTGFLSAIAGISLLVGGIGIMNIMLVTVTERTREIGIRKALGATSRAILVQFLIEALVLTLSGGLLGIGLGLLSGDLVAGALNSTARYSVESLALAVGISTLVGLVFGVYPASRAAKLHPIEALRYE